MKQKAQEMQREGIKLNDEQIRRFICDGVLVLNSGLAPDANQQIFDKIKWNNDHEFNMGNNVLPRVAELQQVLDSPVIHGAMQSILGDDYLLHPHRYMHASEPLPEPERMRNLKGDEHGPPMGEGSSGNSTWHQDGQCPLGRARYHVPRMAMIIYFPQDTPAERGPTRVIPGTHLQACLSKDNYPYALVSDRIKAGTCLLLAFDIAHAALSNQTDISRYMVKFVFMRTSHPTKSSWDGGNDPWQSPKERLGQFDHTRTWSYIWDWMRGAPRPTSSEPRDIQQLLASLNGTDQKARLEAIYELASMSAKAIEPLKESLLQTAGLGRQVTAKFLIDEYGAYVPEGDRFERRWNDIGFVPQDEAYALGSIGEDAVSTLIELLGHTDPWIKINAAFALGEVGPPAARAMPDLAKLLDHELHQVARIALDSMAYIGTNTRAALPAISKLLTVSNPGWQNDSQRNSWSGENQAHFNALCALYNSDIPKEEMEDLLVTCLDDTCGYIPGMALEILTREDDIHESVGLLRALDYLKVHRWDDTLAKDYRVF